MSPRYVATMQAWLHITIVKWSRINKNLHFLRYVFFRHISIKFPIVTLKTYHHRKEMSYRGSWDSFGNGMTRGTTWEGVDYLAVTKVQTRIALPGHPPHPGGAAPPFLWHQAWYLHQEAALHSDKEYAWNGGYRVKICFGLSKPILHSLLNSVHSVYFTVVFLYVTATHRVDGFWLYVYNVQMFSVHWCAVCSVQCALGSVHTAVCSVKCAVHTGDRCASLLRKLGTSLRWECSTDQVGAVL